MLAEFRENLKRNYWFLQDIIAQFGAQVNMPFNGYQSLP